MYIKKSDITPILISLIILTIVLVASPYFGINLKEPIDFNSLPYFPYSIIILIVVMALLALRNVHKMYEMVKEASAIPGIKKTTLGSFRSQDWVNPTFSFIYKNASFYFYSELLESKGNKDKISYGLSIFLEKDHKNIPAIKTTDLEEKYGELSMNLESEGELLISLEADVQTKKDSSSIIVKGRHYKNRQQFIKSFLQDLLPLVYKISEKIEE